MDMTTLRPGCDGTGAPSSKGPIMPTMSPGNRLYLYQLLRREIGTGRQTLLSRVEEVLVADDLAPQDLGYDSTRDFLESLGDMIKLTVFKKGNTYATLVQNDEWDRILAEPEGPSAQQKAAAKGKPWKHRSKAKTLRPAKPRRRKQKVEPAPEPGTPVAEVVPEPEAGPQETTALAPEAGRESEPEAQDVPPADEPETESAPEALPTMMADQTTPEPEETPAAEDDGESAADAAAPTPAETDAPAANEGTPESPEGDGTPVEATPLDAGRPSSPVSTPHIKLTVTYDPYAGIERDIAATERNLSEAVLETARDLRPANAEPTPTTAAPAPQPQPTAPPTPAPVPEPTYTLLDQAEEVTIEPVPVLVGLPEDFGAEVYVPNGPLSLLYQLMPPSESPTELLAEDWQVARSTRAYEGTRNLVSFPLRLVHEGGTPVWVTMRRTTRPASGRHWALAAVDGNDGTQPPAQDAGPEGLSQAGAAVERLLARSVDLGSPREALASLASVAAPETWDLPDEPGGLGVLRLYLAMTFRSVLEQGLLQGSPDGAFAAFDTGLISSLSEHVYACLAAQGNGAPWNLLGFSTTGEGELGSRLGELEALPAAPCHLAGFGDLFVRPSSTVNLSHDLTRKLEDGADDLVAAAVRRCAADYRLVAPGVDVTTGDPRLLLPLAPLGGPSAACALSVARQDGGTLAAEAVLSLEDAYVEARVVSRSMPDWLTAALAQTSPTTPKAEEDSPATHE